MHKSTILLTGATGALGKILLPLLAKEGYKVYCLVRANSRADAHERIRAIVGRHDNIKAIRGDITEPRCGISDHDRDLLVGRVRRIFHCAASISFQDKVATHNTNVNGVHHVLELADVLDAWQFIHVSTAYVSGDAECFREEESPSSIRFRPRNSYEETKQLGETMVRAWALRRDDRRITILRPSILIGCADGISPTFDAYYGYARPLHRVAEALRTRFREGGKLPQDVHCENSGWIDVPLVLQTSPTATLNLVPIDWVAKTMLKLIEVPPANEAFHLVNPTPPLVTWVIDTSLRILKVRGYTIAHSSEEKMAAMGAQSPLVMKLQGQIDRVLDQYLPYTTHDVTLVMERTLQVLGANYVPPPKLDVAYMGRLLSYALVANWGQKVLAPMV